jgi:trimethyllysine dioxygenase
MLDPILNQASSPEVLLHTARLIDQEVEVSWKSKVTPARFSPFWLRDHCHAKESLNPETLQRQVDTFTIPVDIEPRTL